MSPRREANPSMPKARMSLCLLAAVLAGSVAGAGTAHAADKDCSDFKYQEDAQEYFDEKGYSADNDPERLDSVGRGDGVACESLPHRAKAERDEDSDDDSDDDEKASAPTRTTSRQVSRYPLGAVEAGGGPMLTAR